MLPRPSRPGRDILPAALSLAGVAGLAWAYLFHMAENMGMMGIHPWTPSHFLMMFLMWAVMMVGMMTPSVLPAVLIFQQIARKAHREGSAALPVSAFVSGYLAMWVLFSLFATALQWALDRAALLSPAMVAKSPALGAGILMAAGLYQWLPVKNRCLTHCRSPAHFIAEHWRPGAFGALLGGLSHGAYCLGCCWVLMGLLFVGGVMNLVWVAAITVFILLEKLLPRGDAGGRAVGLVMMAAGGYLLV